MVFLFIFFRASLTGVDENGTTLPLPPPVVITVALGPTKAMEPRRGSTPSSFFSITMPSRASAKAVSCDDGLSSGMSSSFCFRSNIPNAMTVCRMCFTFSSITLSSTVPASMAARILSTVKFLPFGISRSMPLLAAATVEYTDVQSDIIMPSKPQRLRSTSLLSHAFSVECTPLSRL